MRVRESTAIQRVCVRVAQQTLTLYVRVRILHPLPESYPWNLNDFRDFFFIPNGLRVFSNYMKCNFKNDFVTNLQNHSGKMLTNSAGGAKKYSQAVAF